jgi:hypothetical protein
VTFKNAIWMHHPIGAGNYFRIFLYPRRSSEAGDLLKSRRLLSFCSEDRKAEEKVPLEPRNGIQVSRMFICVF